MFEQRSQANTSPKLIRKSVSKIPETSSTQPKTNLNSAIGSSATNQNQNKEVKFRITGINKNQKSPESSNGNSSKEPPLVLAPPPKLSDIQNSHKPVLQSQLFEMKVPLPPTLPSNISENKIQPEEVPVVKYQTIQKVLGKSEALTKDEQSQSKMADNESGEQPSQIKTPNDQGNIGMNSSIPEPNPEIIRKTTFSKINLLSNDKIVHPLPPPPPPSRVHDITSISALPPIPPPLPIFDISQIKYPEMTPCNNVQHTDDPPPPAPPPLPSLTKATKKTNVLVGWVKSTPDEPLVNKDNDKEPSNLKPKDNDILETKKAPPVVAAPPSLECVMEAKKAPPVVVSPPSLESVMKISERDPSSRLVPNIRDSGSSSIHSGDNEEETYDNEEEVLNSEPWYFNITREEASVLMKEATKKGSYMMRPSENKQYVLMVRTENKEIKKFKVQRCKNGWILGDPSNLKKIHSSISGLMEYYKANGIKFGNSNIVLKNVVPKK